MINKISKKSLFILLISAFLLIQLSSCIFVYDDINYPAGELEYEVNDDQTSCTITGIGTYKTDVVEIPKEINGLKVTKIGTSAFAGEEMERVILPSTLEYIGIGAFDGCLKLVSVNFPKGNELITSFLDNTFRNCISLSAVDFPSNMTTLCNRVFYGCEKLQSVTLPDSITSIGVDCFRNCLSLRRVNMPSSLTEIKNEAFRNCEKLNSPIFPDGLLSIGEGAFMGCWMNLKEVFIPESVTKIGNRTFEACENLEKVTLPKNLKTIPDAMFFSCFSLYEINMPEGIEKISDAAFAFCISLPELNIPASVKSIGEAAFLSCYGLKSINVDENNNAWCSVDGVLYHKDMKTLHSYPGGKIDKAFIVPEGVVSIYNYAFAYTMFLETIELPSTVAKLGDYIIADLSYSGLTDQHSKLSTIKYNGTLDNWQTIKKSQYWDVSSPSFKLVCTDGTQNFEKIM